MTPKIPMTDEEIRMHKPVSPDFVDFRAGIRCAERVYDVANLIADLENERRKVTELVDGYEKDQAELKRLRAELERLNEAYDKAEMFLHKKGYVFP